MSPSSPVPPSARPGPIRPWMFVAVVIVGAVLRVWWLMVDRSLWQDEAMVALNILTREPFELLTRPLAFNQVSPPLYLLIEWMVSRIGTGENFLRLPSLIAGLCLLPLFAFLARRVLWPAGAALAVMLLCLSPTMIRYSAELKSYMVAALVTTALLAVTAIVLEDDGPRPRVWLAVLGLLGIGLTIVAPFALGAVGAAVLIQRWIRARRVAGWFLPVAALWVAAFIPLYLTIYAPVSDDPFMRRFWQDAFLSLDLREAYALHRRWMIGTLFGTSGAGVMRFMGPAVTLLAMIGLVEIARRRGLGLCVLVAGPLGLAYVASLLGLYPLEVRLMVFAAPCLILLVGGGVDALRHAIRGPHGRVFRTALAVVLLLPWFATIRGGPRAVAWLEEARPLLQSPRLAAAGTEPLYVFGKAMPAWIYYTTDWRRPGLDRVLGLIRLADSLGPTSGNAPGRGGPVREEGHDLVLTVGQRRVLVGVPSGYEATFRTSWEPVPVDPGWGANEARRLLREPSPCFWTFFSHYKPYELGAVHGRLLNLGAAPVDSMLTEGAALYYFCRDSANAQVPAGPERAAPRGNDYDGRD